MPDTNEDTQDSGPFDQVKDAFQDLLKAAGDRAIIVAQDKISDVTGKLTDIASGGGADSDEDESGSGEEDESGGRGGKLKNAFSKIKDKAKGVIPGMSSSSADDDDSEDGDGGDEGEEQPEDEEDEEEDDEDEGDYEEGDEEEEGEYEEEPARA